MNGPLTFTTAEVADAIGILHLAPGVVDCFYRPPTNPTSPCLAVRGTAQDAFRLIVRLHTNRIHTTYGTHDGHMANYGAELVATRIDGLPVQVMHSSISGAIYYWPDIQVADQ